MKLKILTAIVFFFAITFSTHAQTKVSIGSVEKLVEKKAAKQRAAERKDPTLAKNRPGRIPSKKEKEEMKKTKMAQRKKMKYQKLIIKKDERVKPTAIKKEKDIKPKN